MYQVDLLPVGHASKSGDAITVRFIHNYRQVVVVIDAGYLDCGDNVANHVRKYYEVDHIDLVISTHPDQDHLNGILSLIQQISVGELLIHRPRLHHPDAAEYSNIEMVDAIIATALAKGIAVNEPFAGLSRCGGAVTILGPSSDYYDELLDDELNPTVLASAGVLLKAAVSSLRAAVLDVLPIEETLGEDGVTSNRNNTSVITLIGTQDAEQLLFTGDAGIPALTQAADRLDVLLPLPRGPLAAFQAPHHGARRNLSPSLLDRFLGPRPSGFGPTVGVISASDEDEHHPSPKVTNALIRRGAEVISNGWRTVCHSSDGWPSRPGWGPVTPIPPMDEGDDD